MKGLRRGATATVDAHDAAAAVAIPEPEEGLSAETPTRTSRGRGRRRPGPTGRRSLEAGKGARSGRASKSAAEVTAVNLLSPWVLEQLHVRTLRFRFGYAALALVVALGLAWAGLNLQADRARTALESEEAIGTTLTSQIAQMAPVRVYVSGVDARAQAVTDQMDGQVAFSQVLEALAASLPPEASIDTMAVTLPTADATGAPGATGTTGTTPAPTTGATGATGDPAAGTCPGPDPFATNPVVACLEITGTAVDRDSVSTLVLRLGRDPLFAEPFVSATTTSADEAGDGVGFVGSVGLTAEVADTRFADLVERLGSTKAAAAAKAARQAARQAARTAEKNTVSASPAPQGTTEEQP